MAFNLRILLDIIKKNTQILLIIKNPRKIELKVSNCFNLKCYLFNIFIFLFKFSLL